MYIIKKYRFQISANLLLLVLGGINVAIFISVLLQTQNNTPSILYRLFLILLCIPLISTLRFNERLSLPKTLIILFWVMYSFRLIYDLYYREIHLLSPYYSGSSKIAFYAFGGILIPMTVILFTNLKIKASYFKKGLKSVLDLAAIATILGVLIVYKNNFFNVFLDRYYLINEEFIGEYGSMFTPIVISRLGAIIVVNNLISQYKRHKYIEITSSILGIILLFLGASRAPLIICAVCVLIFLWTKSKKQLFFYLVLISTIILLIKPFFKILDLSLINRLANSENNRIEHWKSAIDGFINNPIFGNQIFDTYLFQYPHNIILESFMSLGFFGGILILIIIINSLRTYNFFRRNNFFEIYYLYAQFLIFAMISGSIFFSVEFWILTACIANRETICFKT